MANPFYNVTGNPQTGAKGLSALMRSEFLLIQAGFEHLPRMTTIGNYDTVFVQAGSFTFYLPALGGTLALLSNVAAEATIRAAADTNEIAARNTAIAVETARAQGVEAALNTATGAETTRATAAEAAVAAAAEVASGHNIGRNKVHNGAFRLDQRGFVSGGTLAAGAYGLDRWKAGASGCTLTFATTGWGTTITITAGSLVQAIDPTNIAGGTYILSWTGTAQGRIGAAAFGASPQTVAGVAALASLAIEFGTGTVTEVTLEAGSVAHAFERLPYGYELLLCQRFFQVGSILATTLSTGSAFGVTGSFYSFATAMRAAPTMTVSGASYSNGSAGSITGSVDGYKPNWTATAPGPTFFTGFFTASADL